MQDLTGLSHFFRDDVDEAVRSLLEADRAMFRDNGPLIESLRRGLNASLFDLTYRTLMAQFKLIESMVPFNEYIEALGDERTRNHLSITYPVLRRWVDEHILSWRAHVGSIVERFEADKVELSGMLGIPLDQLRLDTIKIGLGDAHRGGRSVALLTTCGNHRIIYKPRSIEVDGHFSELLAALSANTGCMFRTPKQVSRLGYGWVEHIEQKQCTDEDGVSRFYHRIGGLIAVTYILRASDIHYENLIAHGEYPVLIDLETMFHPMIPIVGTEANDEIDDSVLRTGLLPNRITFDGRLQADIGGMSDVEGQPGIVERLVLEQDSSGKFSFTRRLGTLIGGQNVPHRDGHPVRLSGAHGGEIARGFSEVYQFIEANRALFLKLIEAFESDETRVLFRNTIVYSHLLDEARHPAVMLNEGCLQHHLGGLHELSKDFGLGERLINFELLDLTRRDIPMFTCLVGRTDLLVDRERSIQAFFPRDGLSLVKSKIASMSRDDMNRQLWIIDRAIRIGDTVENDERRDATVVAKEKLHPSRSGTVSEGIQSRFLRQAVGIADLICETVHQDGEEASWLVMKSANEDNSGLAISSAFYDLYAGMPGEIIFLTEMGRQTNNEAYLSTASKAFNFLIRRVKEAAYSIRPLGLFAGWGGIIALLTYLYRSSHDEAYVEQAESFLAEVNFEDLIKVDRSYSLIRGCAGLMFSLADFSMVSRSDKAPEIAELAFRHLMTNCQRGEGGLSWRIASAQSLSGLSHGAAGFAASFARMYAATNDDRYHSACLDVLGFERSLYDSTVENWLDRRDVVERAGLPRFGGSWAHGAPGIGIARIAMHRSGMQHSAVIEDIHAAVRSTLRAGLDGVPPVISGDFGRVELPLLFGEYMGSDYENETNAMLSQLANSVEGYTASLRDRRIVPMGLLTGLTGVGYQSLRIARPGITPSIVGLDFGQSKVAQADMGVGGRMAMPKPRTAAENSPYDALPLVLTNGE